MRKNCIFLSLILLVFSEVHAQEGTLSKEEAVALVLEE